MHLQRVTVNSLQSGAYRVDQAGVGATREGWMALFAPGDRIGGRYEVEALIDTGGMSEVYRGRDVRLDDRAVAIKAVKPLPLDETTHHQIRTELRSLSRLSHPHIAVLFDVCVHDGADVLIMELLEGETLARVLASRRLSEAEALRYAAQLTDALAFAHRHDVVHRDVKPGNIIVTRQGVKLVDFGIALLVQGEVHVGMGAGAAMAQDVVGTPLYMAPEQLDGSEVDDQADIYAFGLVFCQMLTGQQFEPGSGGSRDKAEWIAGMLARIPSRPARLIAERCVAADRDERWQLASDLHHALLAIAQDAAPPPAVPHSRFWRWALALALASVAALGAAAGGWWWAARPVPGTPEYQFAVSPPLGARFVALEIGGPAVISPDGQSVAFVAEDSDGSRMIWIRRLNAMDATRLEGSQGGAHPFWSPDGLSIAFFTPGQLQRIALSGGRPRPLAAARNGRGGSWSKGGVILFAPDFTEPLYRVSAEGGTPERVTSLDFAARETSHRWPVFLPDGRRFLFYVRSDKPEVRGLFLGSLDEPRRTRVGSIPSNAVYASADGGDVGYLLFSQQGFLTAQRFSLAEGRLLDQTSAIVKLPIPDEDTSVAPVSVSNNGILVHGAGSVLRQSLVWVDRSGRELSVIGAPGQYRNIRLAPDRSKVALERLELRTGLGAVWLFDLARNTHQRLDSPLGAAFSPVWSPDGVNVLFAAYRGAQWELVQRSTVTESEPTTVRAGSVQAATDWSRDGKWIIYQEEGPGAAEQWDIGALNVATGESRMLLGAEHNEYQGQLSPDGSWLAYTSNESGQDQVYLRSFPSLTRRVLVSAGGASQPKWRADGRELFFLSSARELMSVDVAMQQDAVTLSASRTLFQARIAPATGILTVSNYDVDATGQRFLIGAPPEAQNANQPITVVVNWLRQIAGP
jgi:Tol biopolymer transport system component